MWPKALSQLIELAPHITRLLPMADRFFLAKSADADASRTAMEQMAEGLRGDLGQVTASHAGLYHQLNEQSEKLNEQSEKLSTIAASVHSTGLSIDSLEARLTRLEQQLSKVWLFLAVALLFLVAICILSVLILVHLH
jgi:septal ring factor EnvC (AmiA/AmiB activator)